ncbi:MAG: hypothetical protein QG604_891 [Candidatus Dependentiae bacterium]|nr:hypothetical protein [Candidatus Dependentiae bacterium]
MNAKKLLLLMITMFLPTATTPLIGATTQHGDVESLLNDTTAELMQAYDLLEMLKRRSEEVAHTSVVPDFDIYLPRTLDQIRKPLKAKLLEVLSATPFSDPEKHLADCQEAIVALEHYLGTLKSITAQQQEHQARAPIAYVPRSHGMHRKTVRRHRAPAPTETQPVTTPATSDGFDQLAKAYDLHEPITSTPAVATPAATPQAPATTTTPPIPAVSTPVATTPATTPEPVTPAPNPFAALFKTPSTPTTTPPAPTLTPITPPVAPTITPPVTPMTTPSVPLFKVPTTPAPATPAITPTAPAISTPPATTSPAANPFADMFKTPAKPVTPATSPAATVPAPATVPAK